MAARLLGLQDKLRQFSPSRRGIPPRILIYKLSHAPIVNVTTPFLGLQFL